MSNLFLYTVPQWLIFAAIIGMVYGWVEDKKVFRLIGAFVLVALGVFSLFVLMGDYFEAAKYLTPEEIANQELDENVPVEIPVVAKLFPAYLSFLLSTLLVIPAIFLDIKNKKNYRIFLIISSLVALSGFFVIVGVLKFL
jgi:hypothetical protein